LGGRRGRADQLLDELIRPALLDLLASLHRDRVSAEGDLVDGAMCSFPDDVGLVEAMCVAFTRSPLSYNLTVLLPSVSRIRDSMRPPCCSNYLCLFFSLLRKTWFKRIAISRATKNATEIPGEIW